MTIACCFIESEGKILVVARQNPKNNKNEWDIPADKVADSESNKEAAVRIVITETGYHFRPDDLLPLGSFDFVSGNNESYTMQTFRVDVDRTSHLHRGVIPNEWVTPSDCLERTDLIKNFADLIKLAGYSE